MIANDKNIRDAAVALGFDPDNMTEEEAEDARRIAWAAMLIERDPLWPMDARQ